MGWRHIIAWRHVSKGLLLGEDCFGNVYWGGLILRFFFYWGSEGRILQANVLFSFSSKEEIPLHAG